MATGQFFEEGKLLKSESSSGYHDSLDGIFDGIIYFLVLLNNAT
jgi:hypothetical protein